MSSFLKRMIFIFLVFAQSNGFVFCDSTSIVCNSTSFTSKDLVNSIMNINVDHLLPEKILGNKINEFLRRGDSLYATFEIKKFLNKKHDQISPLFAAILVGRYDLADFYINLGAEPDIDCLRVIMIQNADLTIRDSFGCNLINKHKILDNCSKDELEIIYKTAMKQSLTGIVSTINQLIINFDS